MSRVTAIHLRMNIDVGMPTNFLCCSDPFYAPDLTMNASKIIGALFGPPCGTHRAHCNQTLFPFSETGLQ